MDLRVVTGIEMEAAMACRRMTDDSVGVDGSLLRRAPWRRCARGDFASRQGDALALVLGIFRNARSESGLVFEIAAVTVEVCASPFFHLAADSRGRPEEEPALRARQQGKRTVADPGYEQAFIGAGKRN